MTLPSSKAPARVQRQVAAIAATALSLCLPAAVEAQDTRPVGDPSTYASINPFIILFGYFAGEIEQRVSPTLAVALAGSSISFGDNERRSNVDVKVRMYPNERALNGFGLATSLGWTQLRDREYSLYPPNCFDLPDGCSEQFTYKTYNAPSFAIEITYQWLLGTQKSTGISMGVGAKRAFTSAEKWGFNERIVPTGRLSVGYAW